MIPCYFFNKIFPSVELIILDKNYGFAEGYNQALKNIITDYYIFLNSDVDVTQGWIEPVITLMEKDFFISACQPKILSYSQKDVFEYAGASGGFIDFLGYPFARGRIFETIEHDTGQYDDNYQIFWASGAAMFVRAEVFNFMGGFDGFFFAHQEEIDLCWRMQLAGNKIMCCPGSVVYHVGGGTLPKGHRKTFLNFRNNLIMLCKHLPFKEKIWKIPFRICLDALFAWKCLFSGNFNAFMAIVQAHCALLRWQFRKKQENFLYKKLMVSIPGVYAKSLVWQYFGKKKKYFSEIVNNKM